jgi:hypothetical protein
MGLDKAKSLLAVKDAETFLDLIAKQVGSMRAEYKSELVFMLVRARIYIHSHTLHPPSLTDTHLIRQRSPTPTRPSTLYLHTYLRRG